MFKSGEPDRYVVLAVTYRLRPGGAPTVALRRRRARPRAAGHRQPSLADVRASVLAIRRSKSMVLDPDDPNRRSCGSFFLNPVVTAADARRASSARAGDPAMPRWPQPDGRVKLSAAWLIEHAGFARGDGPGPVGLSTRHTLAIVCHDGARAADVVAFARRVRARRRGALRRPPRPRARLLGYPEPRLKHGGEVAMADRDLKLNSLARYAKRSPDLILEELSQCEIPAGCGGVVLRWWNPKQGVPVTIWVHSQGGREMGLDGRPVSSGVPLVTFGPFRMGRDGAREDAGGR